MNRLRWLIPLGLLCALALACNLPTYYATRLTSTPGATPSPAFTPAPTSTPTPLPISISTLTATASLAGTSAEPTTTTIAPSPTSASGEAPRFDPVEARLITHGSRDQPYVALTFDLCQKPEYPAGFDEGIFAALTEKEAPATFFVN